MKRYAALLIAALVTLLASAGLASSAQAQQAAYPTPSLTLHISTQTVVSAHSFTATARANIVCITITESWNGQSASAPGSKVTHVFKAPTVTKPTVIPLSATCRYSGVTGTSGAAISAAVQTLTAKANITVLPRVSTGHVGHPVLPNTGGPKLIWFILGGGAVAAGALAMFVGRRRHGDKAAL
jgi:LPXTG-motif cell wall-anchored protein